MFFNYKYEATVPAAKTIDVKKILENNGYYLNNVLLVNDDYEEYIDVISKYPNLYKIEYIKESEDQFISHKLHSKNSIHPFLIKRNAYIYDYIYNIKYCYCLKNKEHINLTALYGYEDIYNLIKNNKVAISFQDAKYDIKLDIENDIININALTYIFEDITKSKIRDIINLSNYSFIKKIGNQQVKFIYNEGEIQNSYHYLTDYYNYYFFISEKVLYIFNKDKEKEPE